MAFQEAYKTQILAKIQEIQDAKKDEKSEEAEVDASDADLETFVRVFQYTGYRHMPGSLDGNGRCAAIQSTDLYRCYPIYLCYRSL